MIKKLVLLISNNDAALFCVGVFIINNKNENPVITRKINKIKIPLEESFAKACTLIKIPERTKKVPNKLKEKQSIERKIIHRLSSRF